ncbi:DUF1015 domain-containing protein [Sediminibacterium salmoneum]|uniref:DUF1015 domain-containing protein n=1 Tax=Sediminibacterium salmoneum TaxID=426421 RepID=UPI00047DA61E|nr:DUF1015 family protein [Sediminibacterium salmoneum]
MAIIKPFRALRPQPQLAKQVASLPYDVLNSAEAKIAAQGNSHTFLHITKSEIDLSDKIDIHSAEVYAQAKDNLDAFIKRDVLFRESKPCYYIYQLIMNGRSQTGLVCVSSVDDYENDLIKKHEFTRPEKEQDRINHIKTTGAQTGNVFLAYRNHAAVDAIIEKWKQAKSPVYDFIAEDGIQHSIWIVNDSDAVASITAVFEKEIPCTYIADGHHRAASAAKVRKQISGEVPEGANYFLTTLFPSNQLYIMDYNRVVKDLNGLSKADFLAALASSFDVVSMGKQMVKPEQLHTMGLYVGGEWFLLTAKPGTYSNDPIGVLDVSVLQEKILGPILGILDQRTDKRIDFVGGIRGLSALEQRVDSGEMAAAISLYPVTIDQLFAIADSGNVMPPKSTWFEPKLRDGLLTHLIND